MHPMETAPTIALKARYVFPPHRPPIGDAAVSIASERIVAVGDVPPGAEVHDLGNVAILPGLVNAHVHLEFSDLDEPVGEPGVPFVEWIRLVIERFRGGRNLPDGPVRRGLEESLRLGTTTVGEIAQPAWSAEPLKTVPVDATVFLELIAPTPQRMDRAIEAAKHHVRADSHGAWHAGLSPHAPYSVHPRLLQTAVGLSAAARVPLAFHLAESREELELLQGGRGPFRECRDALGTCDPGLFAAGIHPLDYLRVLAAAHRTLVIHGNYLDDREIDFLAAHRDRMAVVYCPRTHSYFAHDPYPLEKMLAAGVRVALGSDSRASSPDLSVLAEMRHVARAYPSVDRGVIFQLGTAGAAHALGRDHELGSLQPGKYADLAIVALDESGTNDPYDLLFNSDQPVVATWYRGKPVSVR